MKVLGIFSSLKMISDPLYFNCITQSSLIHHLTLTPLKSGCAYMELSVSLGDEYTYNICIYG